MKTETDSVADHMTRLRLKMVQQKIQNEKERIVNRPPSEESSNNDLENQARLQQAMLRRQELLDKIRREQMLNDDRERPRSYSARRRYTPSPLPVPPSRRSLPDFQRYNNYYNQQNPDTFRSQKQDMSQVKHVIEHTIATPKPYHLPPLQQQNQVAVPQAPPPVPPPVFITAPQPKIMQAPYPQYIQSPPQHIIQQIPQPVIQNLTGTDQRKSMFDKADFMEMMMMQNVQMHQLVMQQLMINSLPGSRNTMAPRPSGAVHHHHYSNPPPPSQPAIHHYATMPAMELRGGAYPRARKTVIKNAPSYKNSDALSRFRQAGLVLAFIAHLRANAKKNVDNRPNSMFLFGIILKEIVAALHRIYLNPNGNIYPVLNDIIGPNCYDLSALVHGGKLGEREESVLIQELQYVIENLVYHITEIMPSTGVLGTHRKSAVFELIKSGKRFPDGYFWQVELDRLQMSEGGRTANVGDAEGFMLLLGIFISRSLVTTILMKPVDYGLSSQPITEVAERNLRVVASALLYLVRRITVSKGRGIMEMPEEIAKYLYTDEEMQHVYSRLSRTFNYAEGLLREWGTEYIRRLRSSSVQS